MKNKDCLYKPFSIYKKILYVAEWLLRKCFGFFLGLFIWRDKNIILLGNKTVQLFKSSKRTDAFLHNTKYLFLYADNTNLKSVYLCDDDNMISKLNENGLKNIYKRYSLKGIYYSLRAKYWFTDHTVDTLTNTLFSHNAKIINLWHGIPLKKIQNDDPKMHHDMTKFLSKIRYFLMLKDDYYVVNSEYEQECYHTAFIKPKEYIKILGSPRLDVLLNDIENSDLFMEEDFKNIKNFKEQGKKVLIYMPTWRDSGQDISGWLKSEKLKKFLKDNNSVLVCKLHPADKNSLNFDLGEEFYKMDKKSDIYPVLKYSDVLITDYSSVYFDYLLLDKPIIYYPTDLQEYEQTRGFYRPYEELTAGVKAYREEELINSIQDTINGIDNYKEQRKNLRDKMFVYQDGKNCERITEWIKGLR